MPFASRSGYVRRLSAHISGVTLMAGRDLVARVEVLEMKVSTLEELPARVSAVQSQIVLLRDEMRGEFSAVRHEMRSLIETTNTQMRVLHEDVIDRIATLGEGRNGSQRRKRR
jgi:hypothetical protein